MNHPVYIIVTLFLAVLNLVYFVICIRQKTKVTYQLGLSSLYCAVIGVSSLVANLQDPDHYFLMSVCNSLYFLAVDALLLHLIYYAKAVGRFHFNLTEKIALHVLIFYGAFELIIFAINPFNEIAISYSYVSGDMAHFIFQFKPLYVAHLCYTYLMALVIMTIMIRRSFMVPREYRSVYYFLPAMVLTIVFLNGLFLFLPNKGFFSEIDISSFLYAPAIIFTYWHSVYYSKRNMLLQFKSTLFDSINQGMMMFDYNDELILYNDRSAELFADLNILHGYHLKDFAFRSGISLHLDQTPENLLDPSSRSFTCFTKNGIDTPLRCDYKILKNSQGAALGKLFVFTDLGGRIDLLTGFINWESFLRHKDEYDRVPNHAIVCDISGLSSINQTLGHAEGDRMIRSLAETLKKSFSPDTFFIRTHDASMIALCYDNDEKAIHEIMHQVVSVFNGGIQYAIAPVTSGENLLNAIAEATRGINNRKLLDQSSTRSSTISSLIRALKECDPDTESHVKRTQTMGAALGEKIGLTDIQQSDLALLCLLHDIGKIGVPLEIMNKPGKLTDEEFAILRSHVEKGFNIAISSPDLRPIASMVRSHHERWDGYGYPDRIKGEAIPLLSRIIAVVDAYDAMVSERSYKPAKSKQEALDELIRCSGTQFDPYIAKTFVQLLQERSDLGLSGASIIGQSQMAVLPLEKPVTLPSVQDTTSTVVIPFARYTLDSNFNIISTDDAFETITGYSKDDLVLHPLAQTDLIPEAERSEYLRLLNENVSKRTTNLFKHSLKRKDGSIESVFCFGRLYYDPASRSERSEIVISERPVVQTVFEFTERERLWTMHQLRKWDTETRHDPRTGILTPHAFRSEVDMDLIMEEDPVLLFLINAKSKHSEPYSPNQLMYFDHLLQMELRKEDLTCYLGDDLFAAAVVFEKNVSPEAITRRGDQILDHLQTVLHTDLPLMDFQIGYAISMQDCKNVEDLIHAASQDMKHRLRVYPHTAC